MAIRYVFITLAVMCASIATAAPITVDQVTATIGGISTSVGAIVLDDTTAYKLTAPFSMTAGSGNDAVGFSGSIEAKTNDNPSCDGLKTVTLTGSFKLALPSALTTPINTLRNAGIGLLTPFKTVVPDIADITSGNGLEITKEIDLSGLVADIDVKLSENVGADKQKILELLGTDITFKIALSELRVYKKGVELPIYIIVEVVKKANMKIPTAICGTRNQNICGTTCSTTDLSCKACDALCSAAGGVIDAVVTGNDQPAVFEETYNIAKILDDVATEAGADLQGTVRNCAAASSKKCFGIGTADACPEELKSGASRHPVNAIAIAAVGLFAYMQM